MSLCSAVHDVREFVRVVFVAQFSNFHRIKVEEIDELSKEMDSDILILLGGAFVVLLDALVSLYIIVFSNDGC